MPPSALTLAVYGVAAVAARTVVTTALVDWPAATDEPVSPATYAACERRCGRPAGLTTEVTVGLTVLDEAATTSTPRLNLPLGAVKWEVSSVNFTTAWSLALAMEPGTMANVLPAPPVSSSRVSSASALRRVSRRRRSCSKWVMGPPWPVPGKEVLDRRPGPK